MGSSEQFQYCTTEGIRNYSISGLPTDFLLQTAVKVFLTMILLQNASLAADGYSTPS